MVGRKSGNLRKIEMNVFHTGSFGNVISDFPGRVPEIFPAVIMKSGRKRMRASGGLNLPACFLRGPPVLVRHDDLETCASAGSSGLVDGDPRNIEDFT
jgi:hypothetical protein